MLQPRSSPCPSCPYRKGCPSGVWDATEYAKLEWYDAPTYAQPIGVFMCHDARDEQTMCRGWLDVHDKRQLLALRVMSAHDQVTADVFDLPKSGVPVFASGKAAAKHGQRDIKRPKAAALRVIAKLTRRKKGM